MTINIHEFLEKFKKNYNFLYDHPVYDSGYYEALDFGDEFLKDESHKDFIREFVNVRHDILSSDREVVAFAYTLADFGAA